ncbi:hypothetical protein ABG067_008171, partial [Albugo candida]
MSFNNDQHDLSQDQLWTSIAPELLELDDEEIQLVIREDYQRMERSFLLIEQQRLEDEEACSIFFSSDIFFETAETTNNEFVFNFLNYWNNTAVLNAQTLVYQDIFYYIMMSSPVFMTAEQTMRVVSTRRMDTYKEYWTTTHPNLTDDNGLNSFKAHYRMNKSTFE